MREIIALTAGLLLLVAGPFIARDTFLKSTSYFPALHTEATAALLNAPFEQGESENVSARHRMVAQETEIPDALRKLNFLLGSWETDRVEFLNEAGEAVKVSRAEARNEQHLDGRVISHEGRLFDPAIETRGWYYWNEDDQRLHMGSISSQGRYDEFVGGWKDDRLVMITMPSSSDDGRRFRMTHSGITDDSFVESMEVSEDGGRTWRMTSRQTMRRIGASAPPTRPEALDALDDYIGHWRSGDKTDSQGNTFHFEYDLKWMDPDRTITKMLITRVAPEKTTVVFEGFKGLEPSDDAVYYFGASPSGRGARGEVILEGSDLVTLYDGWEPHGRVMQVRDVFTPVKDATFLSRTFLRPTSDAEWKQIGEDHWRRVGPPH